MKTPYLSVRTHWDTAQNTSVTALLLPIDVARRRSIVALEAAKLTHNGLQSGLLISTGVINGIPLLVREAI